MAHFYTNFIKRLGDIFFSIGFLIVVFPLFIVIIMLAYIYNDGEPFYHQTRIGRSNKPFELMKFRSMNNRKDANGELLKDVERLTSFGKFIRKYSIDELPQLFNVLKGDMSLIGPRPLLPEYLPYYSDYHIQRHTVLPGITGLAQVSGRSNLKFSERFNYDVQYATNISFLLDLKILLLSFQKPFKSSDIKLGRKMSEVDDIGITQGLASHYFNVDEEE